MGRTLTTYDEEQVTIGLVEVAACNGRPALAHRRLKERGIHIPQDTLQSWKDRTHPERYQAIRAQVRDKIHYTLADESEEIALREGDLSRKLTEIINDQLDRDTIDSKELSYLTGSLRNVDTGRGISIDKSSMLRGRPSTVIEHRSTPAETVRSLKRVAPGLIHEGTAEDITDAEQVELEPSVPASPADSSDQRTQ